MICIINATWQQIRRQCWWHDCVAYINQQTVELSSRLKGVLFMYLYSCQYFQKKIIQLPGDQVCAYLNHARLGAHPSMHIILDIHSIYRCQLTMPAQLNYYMRLEISTTTSFLVVINSQLVVDSSKLGLAICCRIILG